MELPHNDVPHIINHDWPMMSQKALRVMENVMDFILVKLVQNQWHHKWDDNGQKREMFKKLKVPP